MAAIRLLSAGFLLAAQATAQGTTAAVEDAARTFGEQSAKLPAALRLEFQLTGAQALQAKYPRLARKLLDPVLDEIRSGKKPPLSYGAIRSLVAASPEDAMEVLQWLPPGSRNALIASLLERHRTAEAVTVFRGSLADGELPLQPAVPILKQLVADDPLKAKSLFQQILIAFPADPDPYAAWMMVNCAEIIARADPQLAAAAYERILNAAAKPDYGAGKVSITAHFEGLDTGNSRDTLLVAAGSRLRAVDPERTATFREQLSQWDLSKPAVVKGVSFSMGGDRPARPAELVALSKRTSELRGNLSDPERARIAVEVAGKIDALPAGDQTLDLARGLANLSTEGDLGKNALTAVTATLAKALHENPGGVMDYVTLASLMRYEHVPPPALEDSAEKAAEALLSLREQIHLTAGFTLTALDGKSYSLAALRGKIVLLNFWATWCPPCRKEMPDMEKLSHAFAGKGLVVLAVSDEDRGTVAPFIEKQKYTFPVLLDPERKVHEAFDVEGIPKSFIFDRQGRLAAQAIDMRTERQFLEMLKSAGM
jgi:peroxiredoxin